MQNLYPSVCILKKVLLWHPQEQIIRLRRIYNVPIRCGIFIATETLLEKMEHIMPTWLTYQIAPPANETADFWSRDVCRFAVRYFQSNFSYL